MGCLASDPEYWISRHLKALEWCRRVSQFIGWCARSVGYSTVIEHYYWNDSVLRRPFVIDWLFDSRTILIPTRDAYLSATQLLQHWSSDIKAEEESLSWSRYATNDELRALSNLVIIFTNLDNHGLVLETNTANFLPFPKVSENRAPRAMMNRSGFCQLSLCRLHMTGR